MTRFKGLSSRLFTGDRQHDIEVIFEGEKFVDHHPYGSTYASETTYDIGNPIGFRLDGEHIFESDLRRRFTDKMIDEVIEECADDAEVIYE